MSNLWIRSQDREKLVCCNDIAISNNMINEVEIIKFKGYKIVGYFDKNTEYELLGTYSTKERALEVLDEIQNILICKQMISLDYKNALGSNFTTKEIQEILRTTSIYEMPKE